MAILKLTINQTDLARVRTKFGEDFLTDALRDALRLFSQELWRKLIANTPKRTGFMKRGWKVGLTTGKLGIRIENKTKQALFVIEGTRTSGKLIVPVKKKVLAWRSGGRGPASGGKGGARPDIFAMSVPHKGMKANPIVDDTMEQLVPRLNTLIGETLRKAMSV